MTPGVGLLVPSGNTVMERDFHRELGDTWRVHTARMLLEDVTAEDEQRMLDEEAEPAARRLRATKPAVVAFGCTSASSLQGEAYDATLRRRLGDVVGAPVLGVLSSVIAALHGVGPVALFTPYVTDLTDRIAASLRARSIAVEQAKSLGIVEIGGIAALSPAEISEQVQSMDLSGVAAVFCSCTNLRAYEARDELAAATGRAVITSNQAIIDAIRRRERR